MLNTKQADPNAKDWSPEDLLSTWSVLEVGMPRTRCPPQGSTASPRTCCGSGLCLLPTGQSSKGHGGSPVAGSFPSISVGLAACCELDEYLVTGTVSSTLSYNIALLQHESPTNSKAAQSHAAGWKGCSSHAR